MIRNRLIWVLMGWLTAASLSGAEPSVIKALPQWTDHQGRTSLSPSLFERDAYQEHLRQNPSEAGGIRFQILTRTSRREASARILVRLRTAARPEGDPLLLEAPVRPGFLGRRWTRVSLEGDAFREAGRVLAWQVILEEDGAEVARLDSFLW